MIRYKKFFILIYAFFFFSILCAVVYPDTTIELSEQEKKWLDTHPVVRLAPPPDYPPHDFFDDHGRNIGITADYLNLIQRKLGRNFIKTVQCKHWEEVVQKFKNNEIDLVGSVMKTMNREKYVLFTKPYIIAGKGVIITRNNESGNLTLKTLKNKTVCVAKCYATHEYIMEHYPELNIVTVPDILTGLRKVSFGLADALIGTISNVTYFIEKDGITNLKVAGEIDLPVFLSFACRKEYPELISILEKGLASISYEEKQAIYRKWITIYKKPFYAKKSFLITISAIILFVILISTGIFTWNIFLKNLIARKTKQLRESENNYKALVANIPGAVFRSNYHDEHKVSFISDNIKQISGYQASEFLEHKKSLSSIILKKDSTLLHKKISEAMNKDKTYTCEYRIIDSNGDVKWIYEKGYIFFDPGNGGTPKIDGVIFDITVHKMIQLEKENLMQVVIDQNKKLEKANLELDNLVYIASHDLIAPARVIHSYINLIEHNIKNNMINDAMLFFNRIKNASKTMDHLIMNLLELSKVSRKKNRYEKMNINELIESLSPRVSFITNSDKCQINVQDNIPEIFCDKFKITELFLNLINNAIKFSNIPKKGKIQIDIGYNNEPHLHKFFVKDYGIGIDEKYHTKIFSPFEKLHSSNEYEGSGLGLNIVKRIVESHNGSIWVDSAPGKGSTFYFTIPKQQS